MKFTYQTVTENISIDIPEEWGSILVELDRQEYNNDHTETRRHTSLNAMEYEGDVFATQDEGITGMTEATDAELKLQNGMDSLNPGQRKLIEAIFYEDMKEEEYAKLAGVSQAAVSMRKKTALKKLKNYF